LIVRVLSIVLVMVIARVVIVFILVLLH